MKVNNYILIGLVILILFLHFCDNRKGTGNTATHSDTLYIDRKDPVHSLPTKEYVPYKVEVPGIPGATITIPADVDTASIIKNYYSKNHYNDSTSNDSVKVYFSAYTHRNELKDLKLSYRITAKERLVIQTKTVEKQLLFLGLDVCSNGSNLGLYPSLYFDVRRGMIGGGYDPLNKSVKVGLYAKIKLWNKK